MTIPLSQAKIWAAALAAAALTGGVGAGVVAALTDAPQPADYAPIAVSDTRELAVTVHNPHGVLSAQDVARLQDDARRIAAPEVVRELHYVVFAKNSENVNDTVEEFARSESPELISDDDRHFADGVLIVGVGLDPRQSFVFAGEDVADQLSLREGRHLDRAVENIQPGVKDGNIPAGLFFGATTAVDAEALAADAFAEARENRFGGIFFGGFGAAAMGGAAVALPGYRRRNRQLLVARAREDLDFASRRYGELAGRLPELDIRAHSLQSPLVDAQLRAQWEQVRDEFLELHAAMDGISTSAASDDAVYRDRKKIGAAAATVRNFGHAEDNINRLFELENGDEPTRREEALAARKDAVKAQLAVGSTSDPVYRRLGEVIDAFQQLARAPHAPDFIERFALALTDFQQALSQLKDEKFSDVKEHSELRAPRLTDADYRPGYGVNDFVPFWALLAWRSDNVAHAESHNTSSATNTSFSSGFSGSGGSSSF
ncbi:DUF5129 domain-containing protein [Corynebacterium atypicum]|uniref:DUF5129 domain-containing protein n=1 Tax=Corynebacterium atypicum TaxID=191610 RepID=UPI00068B0882|nr:DUF5129 domain-containing protein [Corynebacterium atypicum]